MTEKKAADPTRNKRQADLKARRKAQGLVQITNLWVHPDDVPTIKMHVALLAESRAKASHR